MIIPLNQVSDFYNEIKEAGISGGCTIQIFVSGDCDAIAACKILTALLHSDALQYKVTPVSNYTDLNTQITNALETSDFKSFVFLNCGSNVDLSYLAESGIISYLIDSQKPVVPENLRSQFVKVIDEEVFELDEEIENSDEEPEPGQKRSRVSQGGPRKRVKRDPTGVYFSESTAGVLYSVANSMNRNSNEMLWTWIVGLTAQFLERKIDKSSFEQKLNECLAEVLRLNEFPYPHNTAEFDENEGVSLDSEQKSPGNIHIEHKDFGFMLYRHWSLYESLYYSNYIACKLAVWREPGKRRLNEMLAKAGIPLKECKQQFRYMNPVYKKILKEKLSEIATEFEMGDMFVSTCVRQYTRKRQFSALDVVHSVTALLECPHSLEEKEIGASQETLDFHQTWLNNFWIANSALIEVESLEKGIQLAIEQQKAIIQQGTILIEKKAVNPSADFRYAIISSDILDQVKFFHHPISLKKLCSFIMEAYQSQRSNIRAKPMVLCVYNSQRNTYLVTGVNSQVQQRNDFGWRFHEAAEAVQAEFRTDFFEDVYIELKKPNFQAFIEHLTGSF